MIFSPTGEIKVEMKLAEVKDKDSWIAAVTEARVGLPDRDFLPSECCQICQRKYPDTKAWSKNVHQTRCKCLSYSDDFDTSPYETKNKPDYTIGYCNSICKYSSISKCTKHSHLLKGLQRKEFAIIMDQSQLVSGAVEGL